MYHTLANSIRRCDNFPTHESRVNCHREVRRQGTLGKTGSALRRVLELRRKYKTRGCKPKTCYELALMVRSGVHQQVTSLMCHPAQSQGIPGLEPLGQQYEIHLSSYEANYGIPNDPNYLGRGHKCKEERFVPIHRDKSHVDIQFPYLRERSQFLFDRRSGNSTTHSVVSTTTLADVILQGRQIDAFDISLLSKTSN